MKTSLTLNNHALIDEYVSSYRELTKKTVFNTLSLARVVYEVKNKFENKEISEKNFKYFCKQIQVSDKSSQFRKYIYIAMSTDKIEKYIDRFPSAMSVVYKIISLPPDHFNELINKNLLARDLTLSKINKYFSPSKISSTKSLINQNIQTVSVNSFDLRVNISLNKDNPVLKKPMQDKIISKIFNSLENIQENLVHFDEVSIYLNDEYKHSRKYANKNV